MTRILLRSTLGLAAVIAAVTATGIVQAQVAITPNVSFNNGLYTYNYSVSNNTMDTLALTTFNVRPLANAVQMPIAPTGFFVSFDPGLGLVSFLEDTDPNTPGTFAPSTTVSGFRFNSPYRPVLSPFEALSVNGTSFFGTTLAPANVPEPGSLALATTLTLGMAGWTRTRRRNKTHRA